MRRRSWVLIILIVFIFVTFLYLTKNSLVTTRNNRLYEEAERLKEKLFHIEDTNEIAIVADNSLNSAKYVYIWDKDIIGKILGIVSRTRIDEMRTPKITTTEVRYGMLFLDESGTELLSVHIPFSLDDIYVKLEKDDELQLNKIVFEYLSS